jgi:hypothetical protein
MLRFIVLDSNFFLILRWGWFFRFTDFFLGWITYHKWILNEKLQIAVFYVPKIQIPKWNSQMPFLNPQMSNPQKKIPNCHSTRFFLGVILQLFFSILNIIFFRCLDSSIQWLHTFMPVPEKRWLLIDAILIMYKKIVFHCLTRLQYFYNL